MIIFMVNGLKPNGGRGSMSAEFYIFHGKVNKPLQKPSTFIVEGSVMQDKERNEFLLKMTMGGKIDNNEIHNLVIGSVYFKYPVKYPDRMRITDYTFTFINCVSVSPWLALATKSNKNNIKVIDCIFT